jgi:hypothetical protein
MLTPVVCAHASVTRRVEENTLDYRLGLVTVISRTLALVSLPGALSLCDPVLVAWVTPSSIQVRCQ